MFKGYEAENTMSIWKTMCGMLLTMAYKICFISLSIWATMPFFVLLLFGDYFYPCFIIMNTSLPHFSLVSSLFQDGFCKVLLPSKIMPPLPNVFIAAYFTSCRFILVVQVRGKIWNVCYAGQNHFTSWCGALLFLNPFSSHFCIRLPVITWHCNFNFFSFGRHQC